MVGGRLEHRREPPERSVERREFADLRNELVGTQFRPAVPRGTHRASGYRTVQPDK
jgi:hypothetical protein